ncbi:hypothetical protein EX30DRAFT_90417 [Ascodesmis nigricans]|uniref:Uncharacterized protein n=1 Tax=Ascodesmis nigricans TaxID=341454 RepID=A0A4S2N3B3_9PEZI|nr:hypothetical protein EX30DRAFT_90417 [Ascodesmis nigricans]
MMDGEYTHIRRKKCHGPRNESAPPNVPPPLHCPPHPASTPPSSQPSKLIATIATRSPPPLAWPHRFRLYQARRLLTLTVLSPVSCQRSLLDPTNREPSHPLHHGRFAAAHSSPSTQSSLLVLVPAT